MHEKPRFRLVSPVFLVGFGVGIFMGVGLALLAVMVTDDPQPTSGTNFVFVPPSPSPSATVAASPTPRILPRTITTLNVRLGPGEGFAIIGTISEGDSVEIVGRDESTQWVAVRFPPGSTALGWLPVAGLDSVTALGSVEVLLPTPLTRAIPTLVTDTGSSGGMGPGGVGPALPTPTPAPSGPPDLALGSITRLQDGRVEIEVINLGPGNLANIRFSVVVSTAVGSVETLGSSGASLLVDEAVLFATESTRVEEETILFIGVDPGSFLDDADRSNNMREVVLEPPPIPTPTATPRPSIPPSPG